VHPETGILCRTPETRRQKPVKKKDRERVIRINENTAYARDKKGIWYECKLIPLSKERIKKKHYFSSLKVFVYNEYYVPQYDMFFKRQTNFSNSFWGNPPAYCVSKRQMNKREIKRIADSGSQIADRKR
jgi:hypothetical protein